jgi:5-hydroxyisourate hydrolase
VSPITTHILDTSRGLPAAGVGASLEQQTAGGGWTELASGVSNADGRIPNLLAGAASLAPGLYRMRFATAAYFQSLGVRCFFPEVVVVFQLDAAAQRLHVPLLLSPYGYTTYRGS